MYNAHGVDGRVRRPRRGAVLPSPAIAGAEACAARAPGTQRFLTQVTVNVPGLLRPPG